MPRITDYAAATTLNDGMVFFVEIDTNADLAFESRKVSMATIRSYLNAQRSYGSMYFSASAQTTLAAATPAKAAGTTAFQAVAPTDDITVATTNRMTYTGAETKTFRVSASLALEKAAGTTSLATAFLYKNGAAVDGLSAQIGDAPEQPSPVSIEGLVDLGENDYLELWLSTDTGDDLTVSAGTVALTEA